MSKADLIAAKISLKNAMLDIDRALEDYESGKTVENSK